MRHSRSDYNGIQDTSGKIPEDEPVFVLRSQDAAGSDTVRFWADRAEALGSDSDIIEHARLWADHMDNWALGHRKVPDAPEGVFE